MYVACNWIPSDHTRRDSQISHAATYQKKGGSERCHFNQIVNNLKYINFLEGKLKFKMVIVDAHISVNVTL